MREVNLMVKVTLPQATELSKLEKKSLVSYIYIGTVLPQYRKVYGSEPRIQLNDQISTIADIPDFITSERQERSEAERPHMVTSLKVDQYTKMGIVSDLKEELRKMAALHINYSARKRQNSY